MPHMPAYLSTTPGAWRNADQWPREDYDPDRHAGTRRQSNRQQLVRPRMRRTTAMDQQSDDLGRTAATAVDVGQNRPTHSQCHCKRAMPQIQLGA